MLAMPGLRGFALAAKPGSEGVSCDARGVSVGGVPLLQPPGASNPFWSVRQLGELNKDLSVRYRLRIDIASKSSSLALIAAALNRGDIAMAAIAAVQMQMPDPPPLAKCAENLDEIIRRARELNRSGLLKFWDPAKHPRAGVPPNPGWFAPAADDSESSAAPPNPSWLTPVSDKPQQLEPIPHDKIGNPEDKPGEPSPAEGEGGENTPRGILELPLPGGSPGASVPGAPPAAAPKPSAPVGTQPSLPFPGGLPPQLAPYVPGGKTSGILETPTGPVALQSGYDGPAEEMPSGSPGFDGLTLSHVEGHAAALMRQDGIMEGTLYINNPKICQSCIRLLPTMLPPGATLNVVLPDGTTIQFEGVIQ